MLPVKFSLNIPDLLLSLQQLVLMTTPFFQDRWELMHIVHLIENRKYERPKPK